MGTLNQKQLDHFEEFGFLKIDNILDPERVIDPIIEEYKIVLDNLAEKLYSENSITSKWKNSNI